MQDKQIEWFGLACGIITTSSFVPQVVTIWNMRPLPATAVSLLMYVILSVGLVGWLVYGIKKRARAVVFSNIASLVLSAFVIAYKFIYG